MSTTFGPKIESRTGSSISLSVCHICKNTIFLNNIIFVAKVFIKKNHNNTNMAIF